MSAALRHYQSQIWPQTYSNDSADKGEKEEKLQWAARIALKKRTR